MATASAAVADTQREKCTHDNFIHATERPGHTRQLATRLSAVRAGGARGNRASPKPIAPTRRRAIGPVTMSREALSVLLWPETD